VETTDTSAHGIEIACDESGWEGSNFTTGNSVVIAHASVRIDTGAAAACVRELRGRSAGGHEFKAGHLLRGGPDLAAFLGPSGPLHGRALVHLTCKSCFVLGRVLDLLVGGSADTASLGLRPQPRLADQAAELCRAGPRTFGPEPWQAFLRAANLVLRADRHPKVRAPVDAFYDRLDALRSPAGCAVLDELARVRDSAPAARARLLEEQTLQPVLEPLLPSLARAVLHWSGGVHPVAVVHDEQSALTARRMARLERTLADLGRIRPPARGPFLRFRQADSRTDPRVQVADLLAGVARRIVTDDMTGRGDPELTALLRPYVDPASRWCRS
jgi:hypothetical protein